MKKYVAYMVITCFLITFAAIARAAEPVPNDSQKETDLILAKIEGILQEAGVQRFFLVFVHEGERFSTGKGKIAEAVSKKLQGTGGPDEAMVELFDFFRDMEKWLGSEKGKVKN